MNAPNLVLDGHIRRWCDEDIANDPFDSLDEFDCQFYPKNDNPLHQQPIFAVNNKLNTTVKLWQGNILTLPVDAIVHPTNELFERCTRLTSELYRVCSPTLRKELFTQIRHCKTGTVRITKRYVDQIVYDCCQAHSDYFLKLLSSGSLYHSHGKSKVSAQVSHSCHAVSLQLLL